MFDRSLLPRHKHVRFGQPAFLGHLVAVVEVGSVLVARIGAEGKFQAGSFGLQDEAFVRNVRYLVDFDRDLTVARSSCAIPTQADEALHPLGRPKLLI